MERQPKTVLITGAAGGLGRAMVEYLASRGDCVFAADVDQEGLQPLQRPGGITTLWMDVTAPESVDAAVAEVQATAAGLDGLVNCAGIFCGGPLVEIAEEQVERILEVNVLGMVRVTKAFFPLLHQRRGRVVNISSESGRLVPPFTGPYCMSKFAVEAYSDALRRELIYLGMRVVVIQPGPIRTSLLSAPAATFERCAAGSCFEPQLQRVQHLSAKEWARAGDPLDVARVVYRALHLRNPRPRYRVRNDRGRALVELLWDRWADALIRKVI